MIWGLPWLGKDISRNNLGHKIIVKVMFLGCEYELL